MHSSAPRITIACTTYNHEKYIARALDSFLMQKVNEPFEISICDDASTDNTQKIIAEYQNKYPRKIKANFLKKNLWQKKLSITKYVLFPSIHTEYVALCEGDDYFTDPLKLQKQIDFLDTHKDFSICFHPVKVIYEDHEKEDEIFPDFPEIVQNNTFTLQDLLIRNFIQTNSCMYRWRFNAIDTPQKLLPDNILPYDHFWHLLHAEKGKIGKLDDVMSVYYRHSSGVWTKTNKADWYFNNALYHINFFIEVEKRYKIADYSTVKNKFAFNLFFFALQYEKYEYITEIKKYPQQVQYIIDTLKAENKIELNTIIKLLQ